MQPAIVTPIAGASLTQVWSPVIGKTVSSTEADAVAPFPLATRGLTNDLTKGLAQFCRVTTGNVPNVNGTTPIGITSGLTAAAATGNNWYNVSGKTPVVGDYMFLAAVPGPTA